MAVELERQIAELEKASESLAAREEIDRLRQQLEGLVQENSEPARDACFKVVRRDTELHEYEGSDDVARRELIHRHMSNEITSLAIAAQCLIDFPETPWPLRMELARQCWDESRHIAVLHRRLQELGGYKGEFPISAFEWCVTCAIDNLPGRLASQTAPSKREQWMYWVATCGNGRRLIPQPPKCSTASSPTRSSMFASPIVGSN